MVDRDDSAGVKRKELSQLTVDAAREVRTTINYAANAAYHSVLNVIGARAACGVLKLAFGSTYGGGATDHACSADRDASRTWPGRVTHRKFQRLTQFGRMSQPSSHPNQGGSWGEWTERPSWMISFRLFDSWISRKGRSPSNAELLIS